MMHYIEASEKTLKEWSEWLCELADDPAADHFCFHIACRAEPDESMLHHLMEETRHSLPHTLKSQALLCDKTQEALLVCSDMPPVMAIHLLYWLGEIWGSQHVALYHHYHDKKMLHRLLQRLTAEYCAMERPEGGHVSTDVIIPIAATPQWRHRASYDSGVEDSPAVH